VLIDIRIFSFIFKLKNTADALVLRTKIILINNILKTFRIAALVNKFIVIILALRLRDNKLFKLVI